MNDITKPADNAPAKVSVMNALAGRLECDPKTLLPLLKKTVFSTCKSDEEFQTMCMVANTYNLNPLLKEIYAFPSKGGAVVPIVGVDGWIKLMNSHPQFDGIEFVEDKESCTAIIHRKDRSHPIKATEWLTECLGNTEPWKRFPRRMLRHKAMIQAARIAFGFAGIYDPDEGERIAKTGGAGEVIDIPTVVPTKQADKLRTALKLPKPAPEQQVPAPSQETPQEATQERDLFE